MEGLSKGILLERMKEEYGSMLSTANSSATSSASSSKRIDFSDLSLSPIQQSYKVNLLYHKCLAFSSMNTSKTVYQKMW